MMPAPSSPGALDQKDLRYAQHAITQLNRKSKSSFFWPIMLLPKGQREGLKALYAFCREADDAVDMATTPESASGRLAYWEMQLAQAYSPEMMDKKELHPVMLALLPVIREYSLPRSHFDEMLLGMRMDIDGSAIAPSWQKLHIYCYRVAGCVGLQAVRIFGCESPQAHDYAIALGEALQLTNILRDMHEDMEQGRLYLPREYLAEYQLPYDDLQALAANPKLKKVAIAVAQDARAAYVKAEQLLPAIDRRRLRSARLMHAIYLQLLERCERTGFDPAYSGKRLNRWQIARIVAGALARR